MQQSGFFFIKSAKKNQMIFERISTEVPQFTIESETDLCVSFHLLFILISPTINQLQDHNVK
jgi:hypothetical protein